MTDLFPIVGLFLASVLVLDARSQALPVPMAHWSFESVADGVLIDETGQHPGRIHGSATVEDTLFAGGLTSGVVGQSLRFNALAFAGAGDYATVLDAPALNFADGRLTISLWVNPYDPARGKQLLVGKNDYGRGYRQWGLLLDDDHRFRFYARDSGWRTLASTTPARPGQWSHVVVTLQNGNGRLYVDGILESMETTLPRQLPVTPAPLTLGAALSDGRPVQTFSGALDEVMLFDQALNAEAIAVLAAHQPEGHTPGAIRGYPLWTGGPGNVPASADLPMLEGASFHVIKPYQFEKDGYRFHHGVALAMHRGRLFASYGVNRYAENLAGEEAAYQVSEDYGRTWTELRIIESGSREDGFGVSHGVFLSTDDQLWAFHGAFGERLGLDTHMVGYAFNDVDETWRPLGRLLDGFWPLQEPLRMEDGNWIMAGVRAGDGNPAAVAISHGNDLSQWELVVIPKAPGRMWGESSVILLGRQIINIARYHHESMTVALVAKSTDFGRTWSPSVPSNMPMASTKPYTGTLSTGRHYLISTTTGDSGNRRSPLTIALSRPGEHTFSEVYVIRHAEFPEGPGESHPNVSLAYPYAIEHDGKLYVAYSNNGGGIGRAGEGRERWNNNSIEMAEIPINH